MGDKHVFYTDNEILADQLVVNISKMFGTFSGVAKVQLPDSYEVVVRDCLPDQIWFAIRSFCIGYNTCYLEMKHGRRTC